MPRILAIALVALLTGCGLKGPLEMPPGPIPEPLLGKSTNRTAPPVTKSADVSTDEKAK
jgi:predicted small lipoprotein YifL